MAELDLDALELLPEEAATEAAYFCAPHYTCGVTNCHIHFSTL